MRAREKFAKYAMPLCSSLFLLTDIPQSRTLAGIDFPKLYALFYVSLCLLILFQISGKETRDHPRLDQEFAVRHFIYFSLRLFFDDLQP